MVDIIDQPPDHATSSFDSIVRSYDHAAPHTCAITTNSLTTTHLSDKYNNTTISSVLDKSIELTRENKFHGHSTIATKSLFGITHILTGGISQAHIKRLAAAYTRLKETKRNKHSIISIQTLLHTLVISVSSYNPLYAPKYPSTSVSSSIELCTLNISKTPTPPLHNRCMLHSFPTIIMTFISHPCSSLNYRDELAN